jgi:ankyrin repeat protein
VFEVFAKEEMEKGKKEEKEDRVAVKREKEGGDEEEEEERKKQKVVEEEKQQETLNKEFLRACRYKTLDAVKALVERGADWFHCDEKGQSSLHLACQNEDYEAVEEIVKYLIQKHKTLLRMFDNELWSALHFAAKFSSAKICEILIDNGCDVSGRTNLLATPLMLYCRNRNDEESLKIAKVLIERGADLSEKSKSGATALHHACLYGRDDIVQFLVDAKADLNSLNNKGRTLLMGAAQNRMFGEKIISILMQAGADVTMKDMDGSAVRHAFLLGGGKMLKALAPFVQKGCTELEDTRGNFRGAPPKKYMVVVIL